MPRLPAVARRLATVIRLAAEAGLAATLTTAVRGLLRFRPLPDAGGFAAIQETINRLGIGDGEVRFALATRLPTLPAEDKDRLVEVLVMTLRVEAKKNRLRRRAIAILSRRIQVASSRLRHLPPELR